MNPLQRPVHEPSAADLSEPLSDIGDGLQAQLVELKRWPTPERAEALAIALEGCRRHVLKLREAIQREGRAPNT